MCVSLWIKSPYRRIEVVIFIVLNFSRRNRYPKPVFEYSPDSPSPQPYDVPYGTVLIPNPHTPRDREGRRITQMVPKKPDPAQPKQIDMKNEKPTESKQTTTISVHDDQEVKTTSRDGMKEAEEPRREGLDTQTLTGKKSQQKIFAD